MHMTRLLASSALGLAATIASPAVAQDEPAAISSEIPAEYTALPVEYGDHAVEVAPGEVETITRTRWIEHAAPSAEMPHHGAHHATMAMGQMEHAGYAYAPYPAAQPYPIRYDRETWLEECHARTRDLDDNDHRKGGIIGALLGALGGGIIGNRAWDSERLLGSVVGAGVGGLAGYALGSAIGGDGDEDYRYPYDCEAALDRYMRGASYPVPHMAARSIPAHGYQYAYMPAYGYGPMYAAGCGCSQPMTMIEIREEIPQRVIVRESVREEWVDEPEVIRERIIEEEVVELPTPPSGKIRPIKGN